MSPRLQFTGERFLPECTGEIVYEHWHRYAFAQALAHDRRVLDLACGEGYGSALLAQAGGEVLGIDLAISAVGHARERYAEIPGCRFAVASAARVPATDGSFDLIVSFETIEHVDATTQEAMLREFARLLSPRGILLISSPNKAIYSDARNYQNEFHVRELYRDEFAALLSTHFPAQRWYRQKIQSFSTLWSETAADARYRASALDAQGLHAYSGPEATYFMVAAAKTATALAENLPEVSLFLDKGESLQATHEGLELKLIELDIQAAAQRTELEGLIQERDLALTQRGQHIEHLEELKAACESLVEQRDHQLGQTNAHVQHLESLLEVCQATVQERDTQLQGANDHVLHLERLVEERERLVVERDALLLARNETVALQTRTIDEQAAQIAKLTELLREESQAHAQLVLQLRESMLARTDLTSTLQGLEAERSKLVRDFQERVEQLVECERQLAQLGEMLVQQQKTILYRQSFEWWVKLPLARLKMAWRRA